MAFLQHYAFKRTAEKNVVVCGAIERSFGRGITRQVIGRMLQTRPEVSEKLLQSLELEGRGSSVRAEAILDATRYNDPILLALTLERGEYLDWYPQQPSMKIDDARVDLFPRVQTTFVRTSSANVALLAVQGDR